jgi:hypothetical protein
MYMYMHFFTTWLQFEHKKNEFETYALGVRRNGQRVLGSEGRCDLLL